MSNGVIHDPELLEKLADFPKASFESIVFRATPVSFDPLAPSISGGRWAPASDTKYQVPVLYTSLERNGALAEISHRWAQMTPRPSKPARVHNLRIMTTHTVVLRPEELEYLDVDMTQFGGTDLKRTQEIGAACAFLGFDAIVVPSARWKCNNLVAFAENHNLSNDLVVTKQEDVDWKAWAKEAGIMIDD